MPDVASEELVPVGGDLAGPDQRRAALEALNEAAEAADTPEDTHTIMLKGRLLADWLRRGKAPLEEARLAGRASVVAARRLGLILCDLSPEITSLGGSNGFTVSERGRVWRELGLTRMQVKDLLRLARIEDPDFQRYIQGSIIPSITGALNKCTTRENRSRGPNHLSARRNKAGVKTPRNPSLDEGYSLIVRSLGHLGHIASLGGQAKRKTAISHAMGLLYEAEDLLRPYRGGYG